MGIIPDYSENVLGDRAEYLLAVEIGPGGPRILEVEPPFSEDQGDLCAKVNTGGLLNGISLFCINKTDGAIAFIGYLDIEEGNLPEHVYQCIDCDLLFTDKNQVEKVEEEDVRDMCLEPGDPIPFGECPACCAFVYEECSFEHEPTVMVVVKGGVVQKVVSSMPVHVMVKNLDIGEQNKEHVVSDPEGNPFLCTVFEAEVNPESLLQHYQAAISGEQEDPK